MATLLNPFIRALDANADAVSGGQLAVFEAGTTTPVTTYSDRALTTAQAQPLIANSAGEFEQSFVASGIYKIRVSDADGVTLYENDNVRIADRPDDPIFFDTLADFRASTEDYADGTYVGAFREGFRFKAAASGATDHDITNAGGEKFYVEDTPDGDRAVLAYAEVSPADYGAPINAALADGQTVNLPAKDMTITTGIVVPDHAVLRGKGCDTNSGGSFGTRLIKDGDFVGVTLLDAAVLEHLTVEGATGNGGDGVQIKGARAMCYRVASHLHGQDGFRVGSDTSGDNSNFWRLDTVFSTENTRDGFYIHHNNASPNVNAGVMTLCDARLNGGDGIRIGTAIDNSFYGLGSQLNDGYGLRLQTGAKGNYIPHPYCEANVTDDIILESGSEQNWLEYWRSGEVQDSYSDSGTGNIIIGKSSDLSAPGPFVKSEYAFKTLFVMDEGISGRWRLEMNTSTRDLELSLLGTSATGRLKLLDEGLAFPSGNFIENIWTGSGTLNFGTISAQSTATANLTVTGVLLADVSDYVVFAQARTALPAGVVVANAYVSADNTVTVQMVNVTGSGVSVNVATRVTVQKVA